MHVALEEHLRPMIRRKHLRYMQTVRACGSRMTPAPYDQAQASEEICKRAAHPGSKSNRKICSVGRACACVCLHICVHMCIRTTRESNKEGGEARRANSGCAPAPVQGAMKQNRPSHGTVWSLPAGTASYSFSFIHH